MTKSPMTFNSKIGKFLYCALCAAMVIGWGYYFIALLVASIYGPVPNAGGYIYPIWLYRVSVFVAALCVYYNFRDLIFRGTRGAVE